MQYQWDFDQKITSALTTSSADVTVSFDGDLDLDTFGKFSLVLHGNGQEPEEIFPVSRNSLREYVFSRGGSRQAWPIGANLSARLTKTNIGLMQIAEPDLANIFKRVYNATKSDNGSFSNLTNTHLGTLFEVGDYIALVSANVTAIVDQDTITIDKQLALPFVNVTTETPLELVSGFIGSEVSVQQVGSNYWMEGAGLMTQMDALGNFTGLNSVDTSIHLEKPVGHTYRNGVYYVLVSDNPTASQYEAAKLYTMNTTTGAMTLHSPAITLPLTDVENVGIEVSGNTIYFWKGGKLSTGNLSTGTVSGQVDHITALGGRSPSQMMLVGAEWWFAYGSNIYITDLNYNVTLAAGYIAFNSRNLYRDSSDVIKLVTHRTDIGDITTLNFQLNYDDLQIGTFERDITQGQQLTYRNGKMVWR